MYMYPCKCGAHKSHSQSYMMRTNQQSTQEKHRHIRTCVLFAVANFMLQAPCETTPKYLKMWTWRPINNFRKITSPWIWIPDHFMKFYTSEIHMYNPYTVLPYFLIHTLYSPTSFFNYMYNNHNATMLNEYMQNNSNRCTVPQSKPS